MPCISSAKANGRMALPSRSAFRSRLRATPVLPPSALPFVSSTFPRIFWNPAFQQHPNTASAIEGVVLVADNPSDHHIFLSAFTGVRDLHATSSGVTASTARGDIKVMDPAFRSHFGIEPPDISAAQGLPPCNFGCAIAPR